MSVVFIIAQIIKNNSIVDIFWGLGFVVITLYLFIKSQLTTAYSCMIVGIILLWGLRLSSYIFIRNKGKTEDWRYVNFRKAWGKHQYLGAFLQVFMLQGFFMFIISLPIIHYFISHTSNTLTIYHYIGFVIAFIGCSYEAIADLQLYLFKKKSEKGTIIMSGLWKYSRHPNYFGEIVFWWGIAILTFNTLTIYLSILSFVSPLTITYLLNKVSGVPMLERKYRKDDTYQKYIRSTPALIPNFLSNE